MYLSESVFLFFSDIFLGGEFLGHVVVLLLVSEETSILFSTVAVPIYILPTVSKGSLFSTLLPTFAICILFDDFFSDQYMVISHCGCHLHFPDN